MNWVEEGERLFNSGDLRAARSCFERALGLKDDLPSALSNLGVVAFQEGQHQEAESCFFRALETDPLYRPALLNLAPILEQSRSLPKLLPWLAQALEAEPLDFQLGELLLQIVQSRPRKQRLAFFCIPKGENFIKEIVRELSGLYEVRLLITQGQGPEVEEAILWADLIWLEWGDHLAVQLSQQALPPGKRVICRIHSWEAVAGIVAQLKWERIDHALFVAPHILGITEELVPDLHSRVGACHLIPNGIDLEKFSFLDRAPGKRIAYLGYINYKKGPMLLLHAFSALVKEDPEFELHLGGVYQDARYLLYLRQMADPLGIKDKVFFHGWIEDVASWLKDKHYIICSSVLEGHPVGLSEGMARGLKPLIHRFVGAAGVFPEALLWDSIPDFVRLIREDSYEPRRYREFIQRHYSLGKQLLGIMLLIEESAARLPALNFMPPKEALRPCVG